MLGHQLGQHLVLGLDLLLQELDSLLFGLMVRAALALEGGSAVLEELFLPAVEYPSTRMACYALRPLSQRLPLKHWMGPLPAGRVRASAGLV